eukprot:CAMPEP_0173374544 /NCGR_PEP_ID=MMETSP1144-20121109/29132_1 /TAXON_ID=483371 /ORGANISM="non described non described, Strain CCMP2298" /LENGTH=99 /DNA_ID=CAMNT_0014326881 /DNA_START=356 /DNA_END=652 /DNA_ORIENTATION=+
MTAEHDVLDSISHFTSFLTSQNKVKREGARHFLRLLDFEMGLVLGAVLVGKGYFNPSFQKHEILAIVMVSSTSHLATLLGNVGQTGRVLSFQIALAGVW